MGVQRWRAVFGGAILSTILLLPIPRPAAAQATDEPDPAALLLSETDLPAGWHAWGGTPPEPLTQPGRLAAAAHCPELADLAAPPLAEAGQAFVREHGQVADTLEQAVAFYGPGAAGAQLLALTGPLAACAGRGRGPTGASGPSGTPVESWLEPLPVPDLGEDALVYTSGDAGDYTDRESLVAVVRRGDQILLLIATAESFGRPALDRERAVAVLRGAVARLKR